MLTDVIIDGLSTNFPSEKKKIFDVFSFYQF